MDEAEFEQAALRDAAAGNADAKRLLLRLATDALRRGVPMSVGLRCFLADALLLVQCAVDQGPGQALTPAAALKAFGLEVNPSHRKAADADGAASDRDLEILAAVHLLTTPAGGKTKAVNLIAAALPVSEKSVWRSIKDSTWTGSDATAAMLAASLLERAARVAHNDPLNHSQEVRDFLSVTQLT